MSSKLNIFKKGSLDITPLLIPVIPFGIIIGVVGMELGFGPYVRYGTSLIMFAGSAQIVLIQLMSAGASTIVSLTSVTVVNSRHLLYGAVLSEYLDKLNFMWKVFLSYFTSDQSFAVSYKYFKVNKSNINSHYHLLGSGFTLWLTWQISTITGILLGSIIPEELGLSFAIPLTFISLLVQEFRKLDHVIVMLVSGIIAIFAYNVPFKAYIIVASVSALVVAAIITKFRTIK